MTWREKLSLVPTNNSTLLRSIIGKRIVELVHYASDQPAVLLADHAFAARGVTAQQLFSQADGPAGLVLEEGLALVFYGDEELASIAVEVADRAELDADWTLGIASDDPEYSEPRFARVRGRSIVAIRVLQPVFDPHVAAARLFERPREAGVGLGLDDGTELIFSFALVDAPNNFAVLTAEDVSSVRAREVARWP